MRIVNWLIACGVQAPTNLRVGGIQLVVGTELTLIVLYANERKSELVLSAVEVLRIGVDKL
ncbi:hypothetical protein [Nostoc punctiforme]|uniref:hypothetical protein n=1 Tax=Nostoc punctiforme TaxID=272131 RepID=UPI000045C15F|nr:hypothetical protein [Nostoc punctiforme]